MSTTGKTKSLSLIDDNPRIKVLKKAMNPFMTLPREFFYIERNDNQDKRAPEIITKTFWDKKSLEEYLSKVDCEPKSVKVFKSKGFEKVTAIVRRKTSIDIQD